MLVQLHDFIRKCQAAANAADRAQRDLLKQQDMWAAATEIMVTNSSDPDRAFDQVRVSHFQECTHGRTSCMLVAGVPWW